MISLVRLLRLGLQACEEEAGGEGREGNRNVQGDRFYALGLQVSTQISTFRAADRVRCTYQAVNQGLAVQRKRPRGCVHAGMNAPYICIATMLISEELTFE